MKTAISIPDAVFEAAERTAKRLGMSRSQLYAEAVADYVKRHRALGVREALDAVYAVEPSGLDRDLAAMQAASLPREDW
ncbi:MAG TPA: hypothetical protein VGQ83_24590 [Polyangia bacterium]|jgi:metal-responsive CopG/Arc/MetJ family transcriptional regulator